MVKILRLPRGYLVAGIHKRHVVWNWFPSSAHGGNLGQAGAMASVFWQQIVGPLYLYDGEGYEIWRRYRNGTQPMVRLPFTRGSDFSE